jgi:signal transduction histidine kinase
MEISHPERELELVLSGDSRAELDGDRMAQVLGNLISNAMTYSAAGSKIRVEVSGDETCVTAAVHNHGAPIPADRLRDIFEPMQQVDPCAGRAVRSVGLGLYIVESIVTSHRGTIEVASSAEHGTTFTIRIPRRVG